jgi:hypothetical protein
MNVLAALIPVIHKEEIDNVMKEILIAEHISFSYDGTTEVAELLAIVVRFLGPTYTIQHRLLHLKLLPKSLTGDELAAILVKLLMFQQNEKKIIFDSRDGCAVNTVAVSTYRFLLPHLIDVICFSHSINIAGGEYFEDSCIIASKIINSWAGIINISSIIRR